MKIGMILTVLLSLNAAQAATKLDLICGRNESEAQIRIETSSVQSDGESTTLVTRVQQRPDEDVEFTTYATNKDINETGSLDAHNLTVSALSKKTKVKDSCFMKGSELQMKVHAKLGGHGAGAIYLVTVRQLPRFYVIDDSKPCSIPKVMPAKAYEVSCRKDVEE